MLLHILLIEDGSGKVQLRGRAPRPALMLRDPNVPKMIAREGYLSKLALPDALDCIVSSINDFWLTRGKTAARAAGPALHPGSGKHA